MPHTTNEVIGFRVIDRNGMFVGVGPRGHFRTYTPEAPIPRGDAFRRLAGFLDENPSEEHCNFTVEPVYRELTPVESGARELGGLLQSLCARHGINLGMTPEQVEAQLARELQMFGAR